MKTLIMAVAYIGVKNSIKSSSQVANMSMITNISLKYANDAGNSVIDLEKISKP